MAVTSVNPVFATVTDGGTVSIAVSDDSGSSITASVAGAGTLDRTSLAHIDTVTYTAPATGTGSDTITFTDDSDGGTGTATVLYRLPRVTLLPGVMGPRLGPMGVARRRPVVFTPASIAGLQLWLRADALSLSDGDPVAAWPDGSGHGRNATQAAGARPAYRATGLNGRPAVLFDGSSQYLTFAAGALPAFTAFVVCDALSSSLYGGPLNWAYGSGVAGFALPSNDSGVWIPHLTVNDGTSEVVNVKGPAMVLPAPAHLYTWASGPAYRLDGSPQSIAAGTGGYDHSPAGAVGCGWSPGSGAYFGAHVAEILVYDSALSDADRVKVEQHLMDKYGL